MPEITQPVGSTETKVEEVGPVSSLESQSANQATTPASVKQEGADNYEELKRTIAALRSDEKKHKEQLKELERLKAEEQKRKDAELSEAERLQKLLDEKEQKLSRLESDLLRHEVITETGLPLEFAERLKGTTKEELLADAAALKKLLPAKQPTHSVTNPGGAVQKEMSDDERRRFLGLY